MFILYFFILRRFPRHHSSIAEQNAYLKKHGLWERVIAIPGYLDELRYNTTHSPSGISNQKACIVVAVDDEKNLNQYMALFVWQWLHKGLSLDEKVILLKRDLTESWDTYKASYETIKARPLDINTKSEFPNVV